MLRSKRKKPTNKELYRDMGTLFKLVNSIGSNVDSMRIVIENYLDMKKDTKKLAKYIEKKAEEMKDESKKSKEVQEDKATE
jgi:predicted Holliday junction resolvase-like endonuclease|tara:strand:- start:2240 stop:2482 length:243 start_codon:yes stop_codon:yes gene_type:complete